MVEGREGGRLRVEMEGRLRVKSSNRRNLVLTHSSGLWECKVCSETYPT